MALNVYLTPCKRIWQGYKLYAALAFVARKGFELTCLADDTEMPVDVPARFWTRGESDLEHQAKVSWLCAAFISNFPDFVGQHGAIELAPTFFDAVVTSLCHEIGEVEIGDIPDDGRPEHDTKVDQEIAVFQRLMRALAPDDAETLSQLFATFARRDTHLGQAIYALDKLEAVLTLLFLEQYEHYGNIEMKPTVTERDRYFMRETGSASATDVWAAHARSCIEGFKPEITQPVLTLLDVAVRDVRGEPFAWWQKKIMPP